MPAPETPVALVTGANRGIGLATAELLAARGIQVVLAARDGDKARAAAEALLARGLATSWVALDVNDADSRAEAVASVSEVHGRIDLLINNAGVALDKWVPASELDLACLRATMETNVYGPLHLAQLVLPGMRERGFGRIVNVSSELGSLAECQMGGSAAYRSSKTSLNMLTRLLAREIDGQGDILINASAPGWVRTELGGDEAPRSPEEGARTTVWLATLPAGGPNGGFFRDEAPYPW